jgi:hypothetical protein
MEKVRNSKGRVVPKAELHKGCTLKDADSFEKWLLHTINKYNERHENSTDVKELVRIGSKITTFNQVLEKFRRDVKNSELKTNKQIADYETIRGSFE